MITKIGLDMAIGASHSGSNPFTGAAKSMFRGSGKALNGAMWTAFPAMSIASGENSLGGAIGEAAGGYAGYDMASKAIANKFTAGMGAQAQNLPGARGLLGRVGGGLKGLGLGALRVGTGLAGGMIGSLVGSAALGTLAPWKRGQ